MTTTLSLRWIGEMKEKIDDFQAKNSGIFEVITGISARKKWIVIQLTKRNIGFRLLNLGAGVTKITTDTEVCPKCKGTGRV